MSPIYVGNAPCSWGSLEFEGLEGEPVRYAQMLDELAATGYTGTELGDWGYMPTNPGLLAAALATRRLALTGAFVPVALKDPESHAAGEEAAVRTATLVAEAARRLDQPTAPFLVLADDNGTDPVRTRNAGRVSADLRLSDAEWSIYAAGVNRIAAAVRSGTGLRTVFHHHCAGYVETPEEIDHLLDRTDASLVGLVLDTGHYVFGAGSADGLAEALARHGDRLWYVHFKDFDAEVGQAARDGKWDYFEAVRRGVFCELGKGSVDFAAVVDWLRRHDYGGFITVEQDILPGMGTPAESARRNRDFLRGLGL
jgi:inosose dehydratase